MSPALAHALRLAAEIQAEAKRKPRKSPTVLKPVPQTDAVIHAEVIEIFREANRLGRTG
jgi:hypothetical protein